MGNIELLKEELEESKRILQSLKNKIIKATENEDFEEVCRLSIIASNRKTKIYTIEKVLKFLA